MTTRTLLLTALLAWPGAVLHADADAVMTNMLQIYTNTADPQVLETQRRGGLTMGRISARTAIAAPNLIAYQPPSIRGGCNGIDLYGGSFSFINKDEMTQALRAIASNAVSYAFTLAMESVCPTCMQKMESLRNKVDDINGMVRDSCHWATTLVDATPLDDFRNGRIEAARGAATEAGTTSDSADAATGSAGETLLELETAIGAARNVNVTWRVLNDGNIGTWFGAAGDQDFMEVLMTLTGTVIKTETVGGAACTDAGGHDEYCFNQPPSILTVEEFIDGSDGNVRIYRCDEPVDCLEPTATVDTSWEGFAERVSEILFGPAGLPNEGLLARMRVGNVALSAQQEAFLTSAAGPVRDILQNAAVSAGTLESIGGQLQDTLASILARQMVLDLIFVVKRGFAASEVEMEEAMQEALQAREREFAARTQNTLVDLEVLNNMFDLWRVVAESAAQGEEAGRRL